MAAGRSYILDVNGGYILYSDDSDQEPKHFYDTRSGRDVKLGSFGSVTQADGEAYLQVLTLPTGYYHRVGRSCG